ncbi:MAG: NAD(P)-dependent oxidoreductase [Chloroflexi bacterium]|nr:NAD(P)-dependent oxidoreductase [Chloroflexota bacterium]
MVKELQSGGNALLLLSRQPGNARSLPVMPKVDTVQGDLSDIGKWQDEVGQFSPEVAVHLAWEGIPNYDAETSVKNLNYGLSLLTMLAESGCKSVICSGSCWEYGQQTGKVSEDAVLKPSNAFAAAKNALHWLGKELARERGMGFVWTRLFYVYGPGHRKASLIPYIIDCARKGERPELKTPLARNDFVYVEDVARAISAITNGPKKNGVYNIGSGSSTSVQEIVETVRASLGLPYEGKAPEQPASGPTANFWADISRIKTDLGWVPGTGIKEGIQKTIDYYLDAPLKLSEKVRD